MHLVSEPRGIPESDGRIMSVKVQLQDKCQPVTLICAYSPTNTSPPASREKFYSQIRQILTPNTWLMGDFNARVGRRPAEEDMKFGAEPSNTVGPYSLKSDTIPNANGTLLLSVAAENDLRHTASNFTCRDSKRWTWRHPRYRTRAVLDHIFVPATHMRFITRCFVAHDTSIATDHRMLTCELVFRPRQTPRPSRSPQLDTRMLNNPECKIAYQSEVEAVLGAENPEFLPSDRLSEMIRKATTLASAKAIPEKPRTKFPKEFSDQTVALIHQKRAMWKQLQKSGRRVTRSMRRPYKTLCQDTKTAIKADRNTTLEKEADELDQAFADSTFKGYQLLKRQHRSRSKAVLPPESEFTAHYRDHSQLGAESPLEVAGCDVPKFASDEILTRKDFDEGIQRLNSNRKPGHDGCAPEFIKHGGAVLKNWLFVLMVHIWNSVCNLSTADTIGYLLPLPKKAGGSMVSCFRPICLLTTIYKLYAILVFQKVRDLIKEFVS